MHFLTQQVSTASVYYYLLPVGEVSLVTWSIEGSLIVYARSAAAHIHKVPPTSLHRGSTINQKSRAGHACGRICLNLPGFLVPQSPSKPEVLTQVTVYVLLPNEPFSPELESVTHAFRCGSVSDMPCRTMSAGHRAPAWVKHRTPPDLPHCIFFPIPIGLELCIPMTRSPNVS